MFLCFPNSAALPYSSISQCTRNMFVTKVIFYAIVTFRSKEKIEWHCKSPCLLLELPRFLPKLLKLQTRAKIHNTHHVTVSCQQQCPKLPWRNIFLPSTNIFPGVIKNGPPSFRTTGGTFLRSRRKNLMRREPNSLRKLKRTSTVKRDINRQPLKFLQGKDKFKIFPLALKN